MEKITHKRESGISRIVGVEENTEEEILSLFGEQFRNQKSSSLEKEKTGEVNELIETVAKLIKDFVRKYGGESPDIQPESIHIIDVSKLTAEQRQVMEKKYKDTASFYVPETQIIVMLIDFTEGNKLRFTQSLVHETLHLSSFMSFQKSGEAGGDLKLAWEESGQEKKVFLKRRRVGFRIVSSRGKIVYFYNIDEALITELVRKFDWELFSKIPALSEEYLIREKAEKQLFDNEREALWRSIAHFKTVEVRKAADKYQREIIGFSYPYEQERKQLNELIDELYEKNGDGFASREKVFNLFVRAVMTGRLSPVAKLIKKTYGRGSFKELGKKTGQSMEPASGISNQ